MLALLGARVLDGLGGAPHEGMTVLVDDGRVAGLLRGRPPADCEVVDLAGATVLPGLIDVHVHMSAPGPVTAESSAALVGVAARFLDRGYTTVRDLGSYGDSLFDLRTSIDRRLTSGPELILCGQVLSAPGPGADSFLGMYRQCSGPDDVRRAVREQVAKGADVIKVMVTGALTVEGEDVGPAQLGAIELSALVDEAARVGLPVAAHAEGADGIALAVAAGVDSIEHGEMAYAIPHVLDQMADRGIVLVPTLCVFGAVATQFGDRFSPQLRERALRLGEAAWLTVAAAHAAGVRIAAGADAPPHGDNARELALLVDAGLPARDAVMAATSIAAQVCRRFADVGSIEVGKRADLVVVDGDPLADIGVLADPSRLRLVLKDGRIVRAAPGPDDAGLDAVGRLT